MRFIFYAAGWTVLLLLRVLPQQCNSPHYFFLLLNALGTSTLRVVPPLNISAEEVDEAAELLDRALADVAQMPISKA